jgi:putative oxidoreductase
VINILRSIEGLIVRCVPYSFVCLVLRVALAVPFFKSGLTKWDAPFKLSESTVLLFSEEFKLHIWGKLYDYPYPGIMALVAACAEIILPVMLVLGMGTRLAAFMLLVQTAIIQLTIPDGWANFHLPWAAMAMAIIVLGPGKIAVDRMLGR